MLLEQRAARNHSLFREVNERIESINHRFTGFTTNEYVCECADESCTAHLSLTLEEYEALRQNPARFAVRPDGAHVWHKVEVVVEANERYWIVEKVGGAAVTADTSIPGRARRQPKEPMSNRRGAPTLSWVMRGSSAKRRGKSRSVRVGGA